MLTSTVHIAVITPPYSMSLFCYTFAAAYTLCCVYQHLWQRVVRCNGICFGWSWQQSRVHVLPLELETEWIEGRINSLFRFKCLYLPVPRKILEYKKILHGTPQRRLRIYLSFYFRFTLPASGKPQVKKVHCTRVSWHLRITTWQQAE
jgi:hypothetical protein